MGKTKSRCKYRAKSNCTERGPTKMMADEEEVLAAPANRWKRGLVQSGGKPSIPSSEKIQVAPGSGHLGEWSLEPKAEAPNQKDGNPETGNKERRRAFRKRNEKERITEREIKGQSGSIAEGSEATMENDSD